MHTAEGRWFLVLWKYNFFVGQKFKTTICLQKRASEGLKRVSSFKNNGNCRLISLLKIGSMVDHNSRPSTMTFWRLIVFGYKNFVNKKPNQNWTILLANRSNGLVGLSKIVFI